MWHKKKMGLCLVASIIGGWEIILMLAFILVLLGAKNLPDVSKGFGRGFEEFKKATKQATEEIAKQLEVEQRKKREHEYDGHPWLAGLTIILGAICLMLMLYELSK